MSKNSNVVENGAIAPVEPIEMNGNNMEIMPVNDRYYGQDDLYEIKPWQTAAVLGGAAVFGALFCKAGEFVVRKWIKPNVIKLADKFKKQDEKKENEKQNQNDSDDKQSKSAENVDTVITYKDKNGKKHTFKTAQELADFVNGKEATSNASKK